MESLIVAGLVSLGLLPKAVLEAAYFKDRNGAKRTLFIWFLIVLCLCLAFCLSLLLDYMG